MPNRLTFSCILLSLLLAAIPAAHSRLPPSAWEMLFQDHPDLRKQASSLEREVLQLMSPEQLEEYLKGASPEGIVLSNGESLDVFLDRKGAGGFEILWYSIDGGGGKSSGGDFVLSGTIGQPDAGIMTGGQFSLTGGFWAVETDSPKLFCDGFESGNPNNWTNTVGG